MLRIHLSHRPATGTAGDATQGGDTVYAVIETGGKQYRVAAGDTIEVERLPAEAGSQVEIDRVLMVAGDEGVTIGAPVVSGAAVLATVTEHLRGPKIVVFKMKPKKRYRRKTGHRQELTRLKIDSIRTA
jgi:large subunit ribosomal protein L21